MGYFGIDNNPPKLTDWAQGIAAFIAVPAAIITFFKLIRRDKDQQLQIEALTEIMLETQKQTQQFEYQTILMRESNEILKEQLTIISSSLKQDNNFKEALYELENRKRKSEIKPYFIYAGSVGMGSLGSYEIKLKNIGKTAYLKNIIVFEDCLIDFYKQFDEDKMVNQNEEIKVSGTIRNNEYSVNNVDFKFRLEFVDIENNLYGQSISRINGGSYKIGIPE